MNEKLKQYIDQLFASAPQTVRIAELKEELLQNLTDKFNDLVAEGKSEEEAYRIAIAGIGDINELIGGEQPLATGAAKAKAQDPQKAHGSSRTIGISIALAAVILLAVLFLTSAIDRARNRTVSHDGYASVVTQAPETASQQAPAPAGQPTPMPVYHGDDRDDDHEHDDDWEDDDDRHSGGKNTAVSTGSGSVDATRVTDVEIEWVAGNVQIISGTGNEITFTETSAKTLTDGQTLRYRLTNGKLSITYCEQTNTLWDWLSADRLNMPAKDLTVTIPESSLSSLNELEIDSVSANVSGGGLAMRKLSVETLSGKVALSEISGDRLSIETTSSRAELSSVSVDRLDLQTTSGSIDAALLNARKVELETVSGDLSLAFASLPGEIESEAVSGTVRVALPENGADFTLRMSSVSGDLRCDFPTVNQNNAYVAGSGAARFRFESVSGDVEILKR